MEQPLHQLIKIPVVFAADNNYVVPTIVAITSMLINKKQDTFYDIFILDDKITEENKKKFFWAQYKDNYKLSFLPVDLEDFYKANCYGTWVPAIYAKYFICDLLPQYKKCIWLDSDTIILSDLAELYNIDLYNNYIGAVKSPGTNYNVAAGKHTVLSREKYYLKCINVGVLLLNLEALRNIGGGSYFLNETLYTVSLAPPAAVTEQDMLNKLLINNILYLPLKYNFYMNNLSNAYVRHYYPFCFSREVIEEAFLRPVIIHYALPEKPWIYSNAGSAYMNFYKFSAPLWHIYYSKSPLSGQNLRQKRIGFLSMAWYYLKPLMKQSQILLKIKRRFTNTQFDSPIHDFFD